MRKAEASVISYDVDVKAMGVLTKWRKQQGSSATCEALLVALVLCDNIQGKDELVLQWNLKGNNNPCFISNLVGTFIGSLMIIIRAS